MGTVNVVDMKRQATDGRLEVLDYAREVVTVDRANAYGKPEDNFRHIADLQAVYLSAIAERGMEPHDVAVMNILQKIARLIQTPHHFDSWADIAGYAACGYQAAKP